MIRSWARKLRRFLADEAGPTAVEYAVMLMAIILVLITAIQMVGQITTDSMQDSNQKIEEAVTGS